MQCDLYIVMYYAESQIDVIQLVKVFRMMPNKLVNIIKENILQLQ